MRLIIPSLVTVFLGVLSLAMLFYYYSVENEFRDNYKTINNVFNSLQKDQERISYGILQSALFSYYNQDEIARDRQHLLNTVKQLSSHPLLKTSHYQPLKIQSDKLQVQVSEYVDLIEYYLMLNAGIKNSSVFLSSQELKIKQYFSLDSEAGRLLHDIIADIIKVRRMLDITFLVPISAQIKQLQQQSFKGEKHQFVQSILSHAQFLEHNYPQYIKTFYMIMNSPLRKDLENAQQLYSQLEKDDQQYLNTLAISLFALIMMAVITISYLLITLQKENRKLLKLHNKLEYNIRHDSLTQLLNRHSFEKNINQLDQPAILLINISDFKLINDVYGTDNGDRILIKVAQLLMSKFSNKPEQCYRIGGDEFAVVFPGEHNNKEYINQIADEIDILLTNRTYDIANINYSIRISMAVSNQSPLLETADMALKQLKNRPTTNLLHYSSRLDVRKQIEANIEMTQILNEALSENRIIPYFQPIIDLKTREIVKYESLVRLQLKDGTLMPPIKFLPIAQQTPLYHEITRVMIHKTISYFADKDYRFSINFSMADLEDNEIITILMAQFTAYPDVASRLDIELLESEMLSNIDTVKNFIAELKKLGCGIAIDDFGSGYSNFTNLTDLDLDIIKIDGSLIKNITTSTRHYKTVTAIMGLVNELGIESIAEFVQDEDSAQLLEKLGVTHAQGYFFGKPDREIIEL